MHVRTVCDVYVGHFQVVLIVDNQETTNKSMFRGILLKELSRYGQYTTPPVAPTANMGCHRHTHATTASQAQCTAIDSTCTYVPNIVFVHMYNSNVARLKDRQGSKQSRFKGLRTVTTLIVTCFDRLF